MKTKMLNTALYSMFISATASAEMDATAMKVMSSEIKQTVAQGDFLALHHTIEERCGLKKYYEEKDKKTVYERQEELSAIQTCAKLAKAEAKSAVQNEENLSAKMTVEDMSKAMTDDTNKEAQDVNSEGNFLGLTWGLGFGYTFSSDEAIDEAEIVDGVVRVKSNKKQQPRMVLEFHRFLWCNNGAKDGTRGCGPFVAVSATSDEILQGVGMGFMYGLKAKKGEPEGFSIGIGAMLDADVKDLADGFNENQPVPTGETSIRYKNESRWSALIFVTRTF
ncbi:MAG: hypothetical protein EOO68_03810 [Moraxellaceae bacterium]|nr:MAG: hypothetical protein EOO68_03810 [Moraxellaceae bacterium]